MLNSFNDQDRNEIQFKSKKSRNCCLTCPLKYGIPSSKLPSKLPQSTHQIFTSAQFDSNDENEVNFVFVCCRNAETEKKKRRKEN